MNRLYRLFIFFAFVCSCAPILAQTKDSTYTGKINGVIRDSVHNYVLQTATLAIYKAKDSSLISYQLSNNFGEFYFKDLPLGNKLYIVASYMGYITYRKEFIISVKDKNLNFKNINLEPRKNKLQDVVVSAVPPVRMNGDTLEFNADAFRMDPNAVTEDLLRKLPGLVVWGDGTLTVNGKEVSSVLVNGKPFFGGETKVATQNIPKNIVEKVQVYQKNIDNNNPLDSITQINIKLKKNKSFGHFGKIAAGYGTNKRYETDANLSYFSDRTQIGIVGANNNINKVADNVATLMRNNTFKGVGASIEYQPDFNMPGLNHPNEGGMTFQHDFISNPDYYKNNRIKVDYFLHGNSSKTNRNTQTLTALGKDSKQTQQKAEKNDASNIDHFFLTQYDKHKGNNTYHIGGAFSSNVSRNTNIENSSVSNSLDGLQSTNDIEKIGNYSSRDISLNANMQHTKNSISSYAHPENFDIQYSFKAGSTNSRQQDNSNFISLSNFSQNYRLNRISEKNSNNTKQHLSFNLGSVSNWILPRHLRNIEINLQNSIDVNTFQQRSRVQDKDTVTGKYENNNYLSGNSNYITVNEMPALNFGKSYSRALADRFEKNLTINLRAQWQFYNQKNASTHTFQNIKQGYRKFVPATGISYRNKQYGDFQDSYNLDFAMTSDYPTINQLTPLVDSSNMYYIQEGNQGLKPTDKKQLILGFQHISFRKKNVFNYNLNIIAGLVDNGFSDSSITDNLGRSTHYIINADGSRYLKESATINKAYMFTSHQLQINLSSSMSQSKNPSYINNKISWTNSITNNSVIKLYYSFKDQIAVDLQQGYSFYQARQQGPNNYTFKNNNQYTKFSSSISFTKKLLISTNITYNHASSTASVPNNFTIWNASARYRFLKGNNLEFKFSALDILHQNTTIVNYGNNNMLTHGTVNVLQQYYMCTISYFPKRFGAKETNDK